MKFVALFLSVFFAISFARDITATTSDGRYVILHENGTWDFYRNNSKIRDVRESAIPEDVRFQVTIEYESYETLKKNLKMYLEALETPEDVIKDTLKTLPRGGIVHFCVPTEQIRKGLPRTFIYSVWSDSKTPVFNERVPDSLAIKSEKAGVSYLVSVPVYSKIKKASLKARVQSEDKKQTLDFDVPVR